ncbi:hypothetical protein E2562_016989 [Oryza meyeriana var. granulata]|uniref:Uncharacterized protein n=1 Tax=Oryza meyeriana var. granulata TaxID=110450 RepID=A0A6G1E9C9_9ORYZ|nr:hypothetical protein E2562_016989 [Oryza meyeriana var. granulata]
MPDLPQNAASTSEMRLRPLHRRRSSTDGITLGDGRQGQAHLNSRALFGSLLPLGLLPLVARSKPAPRGVPCAARTLVDLEP